MTVAVATDRKPTILSAGIGGTARDGFVRMHEPLALGHDSRIATDQA